MVNKLRVLIYLPILLFAILSFIMIGKSDKVLKDILAWRKQFRINGTNRFFGFLYLMVNFRDFRNLYYFRLKGEAKIASKNIIYRVVLSVLLIFSEIVLKKYSTLLISGEIGGGLVLVHAYYAILSPHKMGENCKIWHEVTIGYRNFLAPTFGDEVQISPGAKIIGGISIGSNSKIGPNALVIDNIPPGSTVITQKGFLFK